MTHKEMTEKAKRALHELVIGWKQDQGEEAWTAYEEAVAYINRCTIVPRCDTPEQMRTMHDYTFSRVRSETLEEVVKNLEIIDDMLQEAIDRMEDDDE